MVASFAHSRPLDGSEVGSPPSKKRKTSVGATSYSAEFSSGLFDAETCAVLHSEYELSTPYRYAKVDALFNPQLLKNVQAEIISKLSFTEKETDIYKVHQTGDLASLSYLTKNELSALPSLLRLRNALYSPEFRSFIRQVTGCGALSGSKQDMSVNSYRQGCHLLNHDDVIGTRRVSYILYMPIGDEAQSTQWDPTWGGALELYPVRANNGMLEPEVSPSNVIPPSWNQFIFFEVQPGHSFHSVEEVVVGTADDGKQRLSVSGWFHAAQKGEEGYEPEPENAKQNSSLNQLSSSDPSSSLQAYSTEPGESTSLTESDLAELSPYLNPTYLLPSTLGTLASKFAAESSIELHSFLRDDFVSKLWDVLRITDKADGLGPLRPSPIPPHHSGTTHGDWVVNGPPHKRRYCVPSDATSTGNNESSVLMRELQEKLFPSQGFRAWLTLVSTYIPLGFAVEARRFRPGLDYTLAQANDDEPRLDVVLGLTPSASGVGFEKWDGGNWGGWECYMAPHEGEDDPAVYRSGSKSKARPVQDDDTASNGGEGSGDGEDADDDGDGTLLTVQAGFNRLLLVLRDEGVLRFVKYVSAAAEGSRWDVCGEYSIGTVEADDAE